MLDHSQDVLKFRVSIIPVQSNNYLEKLVVFSKHVLPVNNFGDKLTHKFPSPYHFRYHILTFLTNFSVRRVYDLLFNASQVYLYVKLFSYHWIISALFFIVIYLVSSKKLWFSNWLWQYKYLLAFRKISEEDLLAEILVTPLQVIWIAFSSSDTQITLFTWAWNLVLVVPGFHPESSSYL